MNNHEKQQSYSDREVDDQQQSTNDSSSTGEASSSSSASRDSSTRRNGNGIGLAARLTDLFLGDGDRDGDLLMQRNTQEGTVVQWLQALDMQVMGACRADERLKPLLKLNVSSVAEDRLLSHLSQHFEPSEVGLLARCLCIPLVSVRIGKINKQGSLLIPTSARGNLVLSLLPTSDLRISFLADDGYVERLSTLRNISDCSSVVIDRIPADTSGRSFTLTVPSRDPLYFWCSEKSTLLGNELLEKMENLLDKKPSLAELTGISDSRLEHFMAHIRTYLVGSNSLNNTTLVGQGSQSPSLSSKPSRVRTCTIQGSLSPRPSSFKEAPPRNLASLRHVVRDKLRRRSEWGGQGQSQSQTSEKLSVPSTSNDYEKGKLPESSFPLLTIDMPSLSSAPIASSLFSPYYCWCPPVISTLQSTTESFTLPPLSSLLPISSSALLTPNTTPNLSDTPPCLPSSQQIPIFTPLMCDPIVHIPVIDICSSGQAYLVTTGPTMSVVAIPRVQETNSMAEKSARNTLRLLISGSSQFPSVLANTDRNRDILKAGGSMDVNAIANSIAAMGLVSPSVMRRCMDQGDLVRLLDEQGGTWSDEDGSGEGSRRD